MKALIASTLLVLSAISAYAGNGPDWSKIPAANDIPLHCMADLATSDNAYRQCRLLTLSDLYTKVATVAKCPEYARWQYYVKRRDSYNRRLAANKVGWFEPNVDYDGLVIMNTPSKADQKIMAQVCNKKVWISATIDKEIVVLHQAGL